jgi:alpha-L-rhamnosidase
LTNPLGIDVLNPRLSWKSSSLIRGQKQTAYRIIVASSPENLKNNIGDLWDSGKVSSDKSNHVAYDGKSLESSIKCYWKVFVWDKDNNISTPIPVINEDA